MTRSDESSTLFWLEWPLLDVPSAEDLQLRIVSQKRALSLPDLMVSVSHPPTVTLGKRGGSGDLHVTPNEFSRQGISLVRVKRGGQATYHGPGQLIAYWIVDLERKRVDLPTFIAAVMEPVAELVRDYGVLAAYDPVRPGVYVKQRKIASVGLGIQRGITYHGIAINLTRESGAGFQFIVPCGDPQLEVTHLEEHLSRTVDGDELIARLFTAWANRLAYRQAVRMKGDRNSWPVPAIDRLLGAGVG